jgi:mandelate racemase
MTCDKTAAKTAEEETPMTIPQLKIRDLRVRCVAVPMKRALGTSTTRLDRALLALVDLDTEEGVTGRAYAFGIGMGTGALKGVVPDMLAAIKGQVAAPTDIYARLERRFRLFGLQGHVGILHACVDVACWDIVARAAGVPLVRLLGGTPRPIPAYNSNGLGLADPVKVADEAQELLDEGFTAIKLRVGYPTLEQDVAAARAVRKRVPASTIVMSDYNQSQTPAEAARRGHALDSEGLAWIEEPVRHDDYAGCAHVAREVATPIQIGENFAGPRAMAAALAAKACDYAMPDLQRIGGVTGWLRAAAIADSVGMEMSSHLFPEVSAHLMAVTPTCHWLEFVDWASPILQQPLVVKDGHAQIPDRPGNGMDWDEDKVKRWLVD